MGNICLPKPQKVRTATSYKYDDTLTEDNGKHMVTKNVSTEIISTENNSSQTDNLSINNSSQTEQCTVNLDLTEDEQCIQPPGSSVTLLNLLSSGKQLGTQYVFCFNFKIINPNLSALLNWSELSHENNFSTHGLGSEINFGDAQKNGITLFQGSEYNDPQFTDDIFLNDDSITERKLWLKMYNNDGSDYWPNCSYIPLGTHPINKLIKLMIYINNTGIMVKYNNENDTTVITETSGQNHTGFIFENVESLPVIDVCEDSVEIISLKLFENK